LEVVTILDEIDQPLGRADRDARPALFEEGNLLLDLEVFCELGIRLSAMLSQSNSKSVE